MRVLIWYRNDLRVHDHEAIYQRVEQVLDWETEHSSINLGYYSGLPITALRYPLC